MRITPLALAAGLLFSGGKVWAQASPSELEPSRRLEPAARGDARARGPVILRADSVRARPDLEAVAEGNVEFRRGGIVIRADRLSRQAEQAEDLATARGTVRIETPRRGVHRPPSCNCVCSASKATSSSRRSSSRSSVPAAAQNGSTSWAARVRWRPTRSTPAARATAAATPTGCSRRAACGWTSTPTKASPKARCCASWARRSWRCRR